MVIKSKIFIKCNAKEFDSWDFCKNWTSNSNVNCIFLVGDFHIWSFTDVERKSVGLEPVINSYQLPIHSGMDIVNVTVRCKNCCIISKMNKKHLIWDLYMSLIYKIKSTGLYLYLDKYAYLIYSTRCTYTCHTLDHPSLWIRFPYKESVTSFESEPSSLDYYYYICLAFPPRPPECSFNCGHPSKCWLHQISTSQEVTYIPINNIYIFGIIDWLVSLLTSASVNRLTNWRKKNLQVIYSAWVADFS